MDKGPLSLDDVPDELLAECGLRRAGATTAHYPCGDTRAELILIEQVIGPVRKLNRDRLALILRAFSKGCDIEGVTAYGDEQGGVVDLLNGMHRWRCSLAYGFSHLPCLL
jgi:hypothetical protein